MTIIHNSTVDTLLNRRTIRSFTDEPVSDDIIETIERAAQQSATSQFFNAWSAIRITDKAIATKLAQIGTQKYVAEAPLLYIFIIDDHRNVRIAREASLPDDEITLDSDYTFTQGQNDAVLALHAMETAAESLGLGTVLLGCILNDVDAVIDLLHLPERTFPVLGLAIGHSADVPPVKPRMDRSQQFFTNVYPDDADIPSMSESMSDFDEKVLEYYRSHRSDRPTRSFTEQVTHYACDPSRLTKAFQKPALRQGFTLR